MFALLVVSGWSSNMKTLKGYQFRGRPATSWKRIASRVTGQWCLLVGYCGLVRLWYPHFWLVNCPPFLFHLLGYGLRDRELREFWHRVLRRFGGCGSPQLPRRFRAEFGASGGALPEPEVLAHLVTHQEEAIRLIKQYGSQSTRAQAAFFLLWQRAQGPAARACKRRALIDPAWQRVLHARCRVPSPPPQETTLSWLRRVSGACRRHPSRRSRFTKKLANQDVSRQSIEEQELRRWRSELADLLRESKAPIFLQTQQTAKPDEILMACIGNARASTIRKRVREWKKLRAFALGACGQAWPTKIEIVLDYLHERVGEPCARSVPEAILASLVFMEKAGCVASADKLSILPILKNLSPKQAAI